MRILGGICLSGFRRFSACRTSLTTSSVFTKGTTSSCLFVAYKTHINKIGGSSVWYSTSPLPPSPSVISGSFSSPLFSDLEKKLSEDISKTTRIKFVPLVQRNVSRNIKSSMKKLGLLARQIRGLDVQEALDQMQLSPKRGGEHVYKLLLNARASAKHNQLEKKYPPAKVKRILSQLYVAECFVTKGRYTKDIMIHAKGKTGRVLHPKVHLTIVLKQRKEARTVEELLHLPVFRNKRGIETKMFVKRPQIPVDFLSKAEWKGL